MSGIAGRLQPVRPRPSTPRNRSRRTGGCGTRRPSTTASAGAGTRSRGSRMSAARSATRTPSAASRAWTSTTRKRSRRAPGDRCPTSTTPATTRSGPSCSPVPAPADRYPRGRNPRGGPGPHRLAGGPRRGGPGPGAGLADALRRVLPAGRPAGRGRRGAGAARTLGPRPQGPRAGNAAPQRRCARVATAGIRDYFVRLLEDRRRAPRDDLVSTIVHATIDGVPFTDEHVTPASEVLGLMMVLFLGGVESTAGLIGTVFKLLAENPDQRRILRADPVADPRGRRGGRPLGDAAPADGADGDAGRRRCTASPSRRAAGWSWSSAPPTGTTASSRIPTAST